MPLLFLVSGWAMAFSFPPRSHSVFLRKKTERLFVPYITWMLILYAINCLLGENVFNINTLMYEFMCSDFWFLRALFLMYFVVFICLFICEKLIANHKWSAPVSVILGLIVILLLRKIDILRPTANGWFYQWFLTGYLVHVLLKNFGEKFKAYMERKKNAISLVCGITIGAILVAVYFVDISQNLVAYLIIPSICCLVVYQSHYLPAFITKRLIYWGNISLAIYAIHCCLFIRSAIYFANVCPECPYSIRVSILTIAWLAGCELLNWLFSKIKATRFLLLGEK